MEFNKYELRHRCFDNNLEKNVRTKIFKSDTVQILLIAVLMVGLCLNN